MREIQNNIISSKELPGLRFLNSQTVQEATIIITVLTFLSKIFGYFRDVLVANYFGATAQTDAFLVALVIPSMVLGLFAAGFHTVVIPLYLEQKTNSEREAKIFVNQTTLILAAGICLLSVPLVVFSEFFVKLVAYGFHHENVKLAAGFMRYLVIFGILSVVGSFLTGVSQSERQFLLPAAVSAFANLSVPLSLFLLTGYLGIKSWIVGQIIFGVLVTAVLVFYLRVRKAFFTDYDLKNIRYETIARFIKLSIPLIISSSASIIYQIVDKMVASFLKSGAISALNFAQRVYYIPVSLLAASVLVSVFPSFSSFAVNGNKESLRSLFQKSMSIMSYIMIPATVYLTAFSTIIVRLLFERGAFDRAATVATADCVVMYSAGLIFIAWSGVFQRILFSIQDTRSAMYIMLVSTFLNIIFNVILAKMMGVAGIALGTTLATIAGMVLYIIVIRKKEELQSVLFLRPIIEETLKVASASALVLVPALALKRFLAIDLTFWQLLVKFIGISVALGLLFILLSCLFRSSGFEILSKATLSYIERFRKAPQR